MAPLPPVDTKWQVPVAVEALAFFAIEQSAPLAERFGKPHRPGQPHQPFTTMEFIHYLVSRAINSFH